MYFSKSWQLFPSSERYTTNFDISFELSNKVTFVSTLHVNSLLQEI